MRHITLSISIGLAVAGLGLAPSGHAQSARAQYSTKRRAINAMSGSDWYQLGDWCKSQRLWPEATRAFKKAMALDPRLYAQCCSDLADIAKAQQRPDEAAEWLDRATAASTGTSSGGSAGSRGAPAVTGSTSSGKLGQVVAAYKAKQYNEAIDAIEVVAGKPGNDRMEDVTEVLSQALGEDVHKALVKCRLKGQCPRCSGSGHVPCRMCLTKGYKIYTKVTRVPTSKSSKKPKFLYANKRRKHLKACSSCDGLSARVCRACSGSGLRLSSVYEGEKADLVKGLVEKAGELIKRRKRGRKDKDAIKQYRAALQASFMYERALKLDSEAAAEADERLDRNVRKAESKLEGAKRKLEKAIEEKLEELAEEEGAILEESEDDEDDKKRKKKKKKR